MKSVYSSWVAQHLHHTRDEHIQFAASDHPLLVSVTAWSWVELSSVSCGPEGAFKAGETSHCVFVFSAAVLPCSGTGAIIGMFRNLNERQACYWCPGAVDTKPGTRTRSGDESSVGAEEIWGCGGWELPPPCGISNFLHSHFPLSMQVLQIVKELVSPSRHRTAARFGGLYTHLFTPLNCYMTADYPFLHGEASHTPQTGFKDAMPWIKFTKTMLGRRCEGLSWRIDIDYHEALMKANY